MARQFRAARKAKLWQSIEGFEPNLTTDATVTLAALPFSSPQTVIRMLGDYVIGPSAAPAATDRATVTIGLCKVSTDAFTLGATAMPDPAGEPEFPWLFWAEHDLTFISTAVTGLGAAEVVRRSFDIRTMRKFTVGESLAAVVQYVNISGDPPLRFSMAQTRVLTTLH